MPCLKLSLGGLFVVGMAATGLTQTTLSEATILNKIKGGCLGKLAGVDWGEPIEGKYSAKEVPASAIAAWTPSMINNQNSQDDIYGLTPFLEAIRDKGAYCDWYQYGDYWKKSTPTLWGINLNARNNLQKGMNPPDCGSYKNNEGAADQLDFWIEADWCGMVCPVQVNSAIDIAWRAGHVIGYGESVYGGIAVAAMQSKAFTATNVTEIFDAGRYSIPADCLTRKMFDDVIAWKNAGQTYDQNFASLRNKYPAHNHWACASMDLGFVAIGLLYGNGNLENSMYIAIRCGDDDDCTASTTGGLVGTFIGFNAIPSKFYSSLNMDKAMPYNHFSFNQWVNTTLDNAKIVLAANGGSISGTTWNIPDQGATKMTILEQRPPSGNSSPVLSASAGTPSGQTVSFTASASDGDGIKTYQWFFGDLSFDISGNANVSHTYSKVGTYTATCYVSDNVNNTSCKTVTVTISSPSLHLQ